MTFKQFALVVLAAILSSLAGYALYHSRAAASPWVTLKALLGPI